MVSNRLAFAALALACIGAAAGGGYLATRQNTVPTPASAQAQTAPAAAPAPERAPAAAPERAPPAPPPAEPTAATKPVQETESVAGDTAARTPAASKTIPGK